MTLIETVAQVKKNSCLNCERKDNCDKECFLNVAEKEATVTEIIRKRGIKLIVPENDYSRAHIAIEVYLNTLKADELEIFKEVLEL